MMVEGLVRALILAAAAAFMAGCAATQPTTTESPIQNESRIDLEYPINNRVEDVSLSILRDKPLPTVIIGGKGVRSRTAIEWSAQWYHSDGRKITGPSTRFRRVTINPGVAFSLQATAPIDEADVVHVRIRQSDNM